MRCPIIEAKTKEQCDELLMPDGETCPKHGLVGVEVERMNRSHRLTEESVMLQRKGLATGR